MSVTRLRWRLRGAWLWPAFGVLTVFDALLLHELPIQGDQIGVAGAVLVAGFLNLGAVALAMPLGGRVLRHVRRDLPGVVSSDYAGVIALGVVSAALFAGGAVHHRAVREHQAAGAEAIELARHAIVRDGPPDARRSVAALDTIGIDPGRVYRSCAPTRDPQRPWCLIVHLDTQPQRVVFAGREPNSRWVWR